MIITELRKASADKSVVEGHMSSNMRVPAAQYLRMSTEDQLYSLANQSVRIREYAEQNGFDIVKKYEDPGKSGVMLKHRDGLNALLTDVVSGAAAFKAILVYDVSRWGRFQNPDEAAHYEFLCARSGIPLHYCAEQFSNDGTACSAIVKALKRSMAAEFVRELGEQVIQGKTRLAQMGFWMGGPPGYGYRRRMVSADGKRKSVLKDGEQKSLKTDRVTLVLGCRGACRRRVRTRFQFCRIQVSGLLSSSQSADWIVLRRPPGVGRSSCFIDS